MEGFRGNGAGLSVDYRICSLELVFLGEEITVIVGLFVCYTFMILIWLVFSKLTFDIRGLASNVLCEVADYICTGFMIYVWTGFTFFLYTVLPLLSTFSYSSQLMLEL